MRKPDTWYKYYFGWQACVCLYNNKGDLSRQSKCLIDVGICTVIFSHEASTSVQLFLVRSVPRHVYFSMARSLPHFQCGCDEGFADLTHVKYPNGKTDLTVQQRSLLRVLTSSSQSTESMKFLDHCRWLVDEVNEGVNKPRRMPPRCMTTRIEKGSSGKQGFL